MKRRDYPILEFDSAKRAIIEPSDVKENVGIPERCVACFFKEVIDRLRETGRLKPIANIESEMGEHPVFELDYHGEKVTVFHPGIGAPLAGGILEEVIACGGRKFVACGGAGVLKDDINAGHLIIPGAAVRDEGVSYHYLPPGREVEASKKGIEAIKRVLERHDVEYVVGKTWTTSALYRETAEKVRLRREEGCITVEMECAAFFSIAKFRGVEFAQILYGGDDVSGEEWDSRDWYIKTTIRDKIFWLAVEASLQYS